MALLEGLRSTNLGDKFIEKQVVSVNNTLKSMGAPFYIVASKIKEKDNKQFHKLSFKKRGFHHNEDFNKEYPNVSNISEKVVEASLKKNFGVSLRHVKNSPADAIRLAKAFLAKVKAKLEAKNKPKEKEAKKTASSSKSASTRKPASSTRTTKKVEKTQEAKKTAIKKSSADEKLKKLLDAIS